MTVEMVSNSNIVVTETDVEMARDAMVAGWNNCARVRRLMDGKTPDCDCRQERIDGCKARVEKIAYAIAFARRV